MMDTEVVYSTKTMFIHDKPTDLSVRTNLYNDLTEESVSVASTTSTGFCRVVLSMPDIGNPAGFDIATVLTGSGITLLLSAGIIKYGEQFSYTAGELYAMSGVALVALGVVFGLLLVLIGYR